MDLAFNLQSSSSTINAEKDDDTNEYVEKKMNATKPLRQQYLQKIYTSNQGRHLSVKNILHANG